MQAADQDAVGRRRTAGGISMQTLLIASVASAVTSYVVSRLWGAGTLVGAAATPVIVALVAESLRKPVQTVAATAQRVPGAQYVPVVRDRARPPLDPDAPAQAGGARIADEPAPAVDPGYVAALEAEPVTVAPGPRRDIRWSLVLATAAAAFAIVVAVYTIPDLVAGKSITGSGRATTLFGGSSSHHSSTQPGDTTTTKTQAEPSRTVTKTAPATTTTAPAPTSTPTSTVPPAATTTTPPAGTTTTAAPAPTTPTTPAVPPPAGGSTSTAPTAP